MPILPIIVQILTLLPSLITASDEVIALINSAKAAIESGSTDPTDAQWAALDATVKQLQAQLDG